MAKKLLFIFIFVFFLKIPSGAAQEPERPAVAAFFEEATISEPASSSSPEPAEVQTDQTLSGMNSEAGSPPPPAPAAGVVSEIEFLRAQEEAALREAMQKMKAEREAQINLELSIFKTDKMDHILKELQVLKEQKLKTLELELAEERKEMQEKLNTEILSLRQTSEKKLIQDLDARKKVATQDMMAAVAEQKKAEEQKVQAAIETMQRDGQAEVQQRIESQRAAGLREMEAALATMREQGEKKIQLELESKQAQLEKELNDLYRFKEIEINDAYWAALAKQDKVVAAYAGNLQATYQSARDEFLLRISDRNKLILILKIIFSSLFIYFFIRLIWIFVVSRRRSLSMVHTYKYIGIIGCLLISFFSYNCLMYTHQLQSVQRLESFVIGTSAQLEQIFLQTYIFSFQKELSMRTDALKAMEKLSLNWRLFHESQLLASAGNKTLSLIPIPQDISTRFSALSASFIGSWTDLQKKVRGVLNDKALGASSRGFDEEEPVVREELGRMGLFLNLEVRRLQKYFYAHLACILCVFLAYLIIVRQFFLAQVLTLLKDVKMRLAANRDGNFTKELSVEQYRFIEMKRVANSYNGLMDKITQSLQVLKGRINALLSLTQQAVNTSQTIVEDLTTKIHVFEELEQSIRANVTKAMSVNDLSCEVSKTAIQAGQAVSNATQAMEAMEARSLQISEAARLICDIADKTNLLAFNAAIEAVRAGGGSRGFSVMADDVCKSAERNADSVHEMEAMIQENLQQARQGLEISQDARKDVKSMIYYIHQVSDQLEEISASSQKQSQILDQGAIEQAGGGLALTANLMQISSQLADLSDSLMEAVNGVKIDKS